MTFFTYRDPNTISSYKLFEQAIHDLLDNPPEYDRPLIISKTQLNQAKVDLVRRLYSNEFPNNEFVHGISDETRANYVQAILAVGGIELQEAAKPLLKAMADGNTSQVIFGMNQKGLEGMVKRGWAITRLIEGVSMQPEQYSQVTETRYEPPELI
jgi:Zn-dependent M16 (insulinase) family peptidase